MGYHARAGEQPVKGPDGTEESAVPAAQNQVDASGRPALVPEEVDTVVEDDGSGLAGGASGATGGGSGMPGHPDAEQPRH